MHRSPVASIRPLGHDLLISLALLLDPGEVLEIVDPSAVCVPQLQQVIRRQTLEVAGEVREYTLQPGQVMKVDPGHIALYEPTVKYDITTVKGMANIFFSGEGLFLATLGGPGKIWLQSLPLSNLAGKLAKYLPTKG